MLFLVVIQCSKIQKTAIFIHIPSNWTMQGQLSGQIGSYRFLFLLCQHIFELLWHWKFLNKTVYTLRGWDVPNMKARTLGFHVDVFLTGQLKKGKKEPNRHQLPKLSYSALFDIKTKARTVMWGNSQHDGPSTVCNVAEFIRQFFFTNPSQS